MGKFFLNRPVLAIALAILMVVAGVAAMTKLPIAQFPDIVPPQISVQTTYTGADALTVEQSVATPLEQQVNGVDNMIYMKSTSANDGTLRLDVSFQVGTNVDMDNVLVQNRVSQAANALPPDVKNYGVTVRKTFAMPLIVVSLYSPKNTYDGQFLSNYATININDTLLRVPGVGQVTNFGASDYAMRIWLKPDQLAKLGITVADVQNSIRAQNTVNPAGQVGGEPAPKGQEFTYSVRAQGRLVTSDEFGEIVVRERPDGSLVRLRDIGRIELGAVTYTQIGRYDGQPAAIVGVYQMPGSNALAVADGIRATMEQLKERFPDDVAYEVSLDTTAPVTAGIEEIVHTLFEAVILVLLVVFLFLQSWRATLIPLLAVPVSLVATFAVFPLLGFSINTLSLFGLVLAIGLVVDDAIVVVEAVEHHMEHGMTPKEATAKAMEEVSGPVIAIALILAAVFIPCAFMGGVTGLLYQQFAVTIAVSVLISAFNALSLSPALCGLLLKPKGEAKGPLAKFFAAFNRGFDKLTGGYVGLTGHLARKAWRGLVILAVVVAAAWLMGRKLPTGFVPDEDQGYFYVNVELPAAASLQRTDAVTKDVEAILRANPAIEHFDTIAGYSLLAQSTATYNAFFFVTLKPWDERKATEEKAWNVIRGLNAKLARMPQAKAFAFAPPAIPGIGTASGFSMFVQDRAGGTPGELASMVEKFMTAVRQRPEIGLVNTTYNADVPQVFVTVDRDKVLKQGIDIRDVYGTLQAFMGGSYVNDFNRFGRQWKVYVAADPTYRRSAADMAAFYVRNRDGQMVPLSTLTTAADTGGPQVLNRFNLYRAAELTGTAAAGFSTGQVMKALEEVAADVIPESFGYAWSGLSYQEKVAGSGAAVFGLSLLFVFLILAGQYESWSLPFSVLLVTPVAVLGAFAGLLVRAFSLDVYGQIGLIMLIGLSAKNSILIVEFAKAEQEKGAPFLDAALKAARLRLRPILMTAFAFILGCVPLAIASGAGGVSRQVMGTVVVFGMLVATLVGIFLTPAFYTLVEGLKARLKRRPKPRGEGTVPAGGIAPLPSPLPSEAE